MLFYPRWRMLKKYATNLMNLQVVQSNSVPRSQSPVWWPCKPSMTPAAGNRLEAEGQGAIALPCHKHLGPAWTSWIYVVDLRSPKHTKAMRSIEHENTLFDFIRARVKVTKPFKKQKPFQKVWCLKFSPGSSAQSCS